MLLLLPMLPQLLRPLPPPPPLLSALSSVPYSSTSVRYLRITMLQTLQVHTSHYCFCKVGGLRKAVAAATADGAWSNVPYSSAGVRYMRMQKMQGKEVLSQPVLLQPGAAALQKRLLLPRLLQLIAPLPAPV